MHAQDRTGRHLPDPVFSVGAAESAPRAARAGAALLRARFLGVRATSGELLGCAAGETGADRGNRTAA